MEELKHLEKNSNIFLFKSNYIYKKKKNYIIVKTLNLNFVI
jgi:hypothetical protein